MRAVPKAGLSTSATAPLLSALDPESLMNSAGTAEKAQPQDCACVRNCRSECKQPRKTPIGQVYRGPRARGMGPGEGAWDEHRELGKLVGDMEGLQPENWSLRKTWFRRERETRSGYRQN